MNDVDITWRLARRIKAAQDHCTRLAPISSEFSAFGIADAYAVAHEIHRMRLAEGARAIGRKIGFTNRNIWEQYGVRQPIWGHVYDTTVLHAEGGLASCRIANYAEPKIEPEIVFHFASAPPRTTDLTAIVAAIDWVAHGIEIVQSHFPGWKFEVADTIADSALHATLLVGEPRPAASFGRDLVRQLETLEVTLSCDGQARDSGCGSNVLGSPLAALAHLIEVLSQQPQYPRIGAGEIVTTGTLTAAHDIRAGETWSTRFSGIDLRGLRVRMIE